MQYRITKQKSLIYSIIQQYGHLTIEQIKELLHQQDIKVSLSTIYRNLNILSLEGKIRKLQTEDQLFYETIKENHYHFECNSCHQIYDIDASLIKIKVNHSAGNITKKDLILYGLCENCKNKNLNQ